MGFNNSVWRGPSKQHGMVLIVGLIMVLLLTIIGVAAIQGSGLQERMAFNARDKTVALLAAETGLRACEATASGFNNPPQPNCTPTGNGICNNLNGKLTSPANGVAAWQALAKPIPELTVIPNVALQPLCLVELIPISRTACAALHGDDANTSERLDSCVNARVTVLGTGAELTTQVVLQSTMSE